ncbi:MAG: YdcF family protein [Lachnospiraceae bacterium]|nr:YdcF family protein [Lachnospiraceae bacterium]
MKHKMITSIIRILMTATGILCFIWFAIPLSLSVNLNIGNATGLAVSSLLILLGIFLPFIKRLVHKWKAHPIKRWLYRVPIAAVCIITVLVVVESGLMIVAANKAPSENVTVVVLGCRVYGERPSLSMVERLEAAYEFLAKNEQANCVLSGGMGTGENISEAECMYRYLVEKGIDASRLYKEEQSTTTRENLLFAKEIIAENGLEPEIAIATSDYHVYRAGRIAESLDMEYSAIPGQTAIWLFPTYYVRELYGILYEWVF